MLSSRTTVRPALVHLVAACLLLLAATIGTALATAQGASDLASQVVLYSNHKVTYLVFTPPRLIPLHKTFVPSSTPRLRFHVIPFFKSDPVTTRQVLAAENLEIFYQETSTSLEVVRKHADSLLAAVFRQFKELTPESSVAVYARMPEGKTLAALGPDVPESCRGNNTLGDRVNRGNYVAGKLHDRFQFLCGETKKLDASFAGEADRLTPDFWRATPDVK